jgi:hypothetical protein
MIEPAAPVVNRWRVPVSDLCSKHVKGLEEGILAWHFAHRKCSIFERRFDAAFQRSLLTPLAPPIGVCGSLMPLRHERTDRIFACPVLATSGGLGRAASGNSNLFSWNVWRLPATVESAAWEI